ncbi:peroxiredoxin-like family protein [Bacillus kexueae]|uniref:peroxiredoxin-like family protein n=1 Tax=Aeribacillus kexueae TaxID=2078952 RepID=UPI001FAF72E0|nr:peroxiredoxin-like family protein [Bacillus kexueae]
MSLVEELRRQREGFLQKAPEEMKETMARATEELINSGVATGLKEGEKAPNFTLPNATGENVTLYDELQNGPVVLTFYRGGWCPYCNLELRAYQRVLDQLKEAGAQLIAVSPQKPDQSLTTQEKNELSFHVLSDTKKEVIQSYNLLFDFPTYLKDLYKDQLNLDLAKFNEEENPWSLPVPATFIIDQDGTIVKANVDPDYTNRLDPEEVVAFLTNR